MQCWSLYIESSSTSWCTHLNRVILLHHISNYGDDGVYDKWFSSPTTTHHNCSQGFVFCVIVQKFHNCVDWCQHNSLLLFRQGITCIIWFILLSRYLNVAVILAIIVVLFCCLFDIFFPSMVVLQISLKSLINQSLFCPMSTVTSFIQSSFSFLSVKWLLCIQPVNLPNVSLSRFSSSMSGWLTPCLTSISIFFGRDISLQCGIEKWPKMGPLYCLSWIKMCWCVFGGLLGC